MHASMDAKEILSMALPITEGISASHRPQVYQSEYKRLPYLQLIHIFQLMALVSVTPLLLQLINAG
jgi:hypothetical protein